LADLCSLQNVELKVQLENTTLERENYRQLLLESQRGTMRRPRHQGNLHERY